MVFSDITVVAQGPVQVLNGRAQEEGITKKSLASVRQVLPGAKIILSTWKNQDLSGLDYDELVISEDPGANIRQYKKDGTPQYYNNNRQIVSSLEGLKKVTTKYAIKLRSDNYLISSEFVTLQKKFNKRCSKYQFLTERVVVCNAFTRKYAKGHKVAFHLSDFFYFGLTNDLLSLWDLPLLEDYKATKEKPISLCYPHYQIDCTQLFWLSALSKFDPNIQLDHLLDNSKKKLEQSDICYANNLIVASSQEIGLGLGVKFSDGKARISRARGISSHLYFHEWLDLYKKYCDQSVDTNVSFSFKYKLLFNRLCYVYPNYFEVKMRLLKRRFRK